MLVVFCNTWWKDCFSHLILISRKGTSILGIQLYSVSTYIEHWGQYGASAGRNIAIVIIITQVKHYESTVCEYHVKY